REAESVRDGIGYSFRCWCRLAGCWRCASAHARVAVGRGLAGTRSRAPDDGLGRARRLSIDVPVQRAQEAAADFRLRGTPRLESREARQTLFRPGVVDAACAQLEILLVELDGLFLEGKRRLLELVLVLLQGSRLHARGALRFEHRAAEVRINLRDV